VIQRVITRSGLTAAARRTTVSTTAAGGDEAAMVGGGLEEIPDEGCEDTGLGRSAPSVPSSPARQRAAYAERVLPRAPRCRSGIPAARGGRWVARSGDHAFSFRSDGRLLGIEAINGPKKGLVDNLCPAGAAMVRAAL
jgi:hypothetical protein